MIKSRKKKNYKLRRRVKRTIASITMVMAVGVAAIPVENLGTVQATVESRNVYTEITNEYAKYNAGGTDAIEDKYISPYDKESEYDTADENLKLIQRINGTNIIDVFYAAPSTANANNVMITKYAAGNSDDFVINSKEYHDYVIMDEEYLNAVKELLKEEAYTVEFGYTVETIQGETVDDEEGNNLYTLKDVTVYKIDINQRTYTGSKLADSGQITADLSSKNPYISLKSLDDNQKTKYVEYVYNMALDSLIGSQVTAYNNQVEDHINALKSIKSKTIDESSKTEWEKIEGYFEDGKLKADTYKNAWTITKGYADLMNISNEDILYAIQNYTICNRFQTVTNSDLENFELVSIKPVKGEPVYIPKLKSGASEDSKQLVDSQGYLAKGEVSIKGIASNAFKDAAITGKVTIPDSVEFIGKSAFENSTLSSVEINDAACRIIGDYAFNNCIKLSNINFTNENSRLEVIGNHAFAMTALGQVTIPGSVNEIGMGCFENSDLSIVNFAESKNKLEVEPFGFYNCPELTTVNWNDRTAILKTGTFAVGEEFIIDNKLNDFVFPSGSKIIDVIGTEDQVKAEQADYDYILAGRTNLQTVTLPNALSSWIPDNTFAGCTNLGKMLVPEKAGSANYDPEKLFNTVENDDLYVEGPMYGSGSDIALVRQATWKAQNRNEKAVPYKYYNSSGIECWEYGVIDSTTGEAPFVAAISLPGGEGGDVVLEHFVINPGVEKSKYKQELVIDSVGGKPITHVGNGSESVLDKEMQDYIYRVSIKDGTVKVIADNAFTGAAALEWVEIGNSIETIGANAFGDCTSLENVEFNYDPIMYSLGADDEAWTKLIIGADAFNTQSDYLTFHGAVNSNYAPFKYAMKKGEYESTGDVTASGRDICYKADAPLNLTIIRDKVSNKATLIDYPHYEEIDALNKELSEELGISSVIGEFERLYGIGGASAVFNMINEGEGGSEGSGETEGAGDGSAESEIDSRILEIVEQVLYLNVPDGVESIDTVTYFKDNQKDNSVNFTYLNRIYKEKTASVTVDGNSVNIVHGYEAATLNRLINSSNGKNDVQKLYSDADYINDGELVIAGLFNGYFVEAGQNIINNVYNNHTYLKEFASGNDILTEVTLASVQELPDNAFYNCENLLVFNTSEALTNFGALPFKACKNMRAVNPSETEYYAYNNLLLFEKAGSGLRLIECFEGRGNGVSGYGAGIISESELANVYEIADAAFSNCEDVTKVDLSGSTVAVIPQNCFINCEKLKELVLPSSVVEIKADSLIELGENLDITVPNPNCYINARAFDGNTNVVFHGVKYIDETNAVESPCYKAFLQLEEYYNDVRDDNSGKFQFYDLGQTYKVEFVDADLKTISIVYINTADGENSVAEVDVPTAPARDGYDFKEWICRAGDTVYTGADTYKNIKEDRMIIATYIPNPKTVVSDGSTYKLTVKNGKALVDGEIVTSFPKDVLGGTNVTLLANDEDTFKVWTTEPGSYINLVDNASSYTTNFTMPNADVEVIANSTKEDSKDDGEKDEDGKDEDNKDEDNKDEDNKDEDNKDEDNKDDGSDDKNTETKYKLTVNYGSGSGEYKAGETVTITAYAPESSSKVFSKWTTNNSSLGFASATSATTTIVMPASDVTITANYKVRVDDDDDSDDDENTRRPTTNTTVVTPPTTNSGGTTTGTTGTVTTPTGTTTNRNDNGDKIYITKNGVSNKDVASVSVSGSTDNFIVKITESAEATAAVEQALRNRYGSLDGISYFPMDISLYDATGQNKITDTYGLNVTVTMPIPDVLIQYGGNARVAAADDGYLQQITPRFTTIDGIACISFVPPHFSPYVIYVDTNNLVAGQTIDSTPATGDPIHPKWFLAIGMACISVILFATSDERKRRSFKTA